MRMPEEIADESPVFVDFLGARPVRHPRRLHDGSVVAHVIDDPDKPIV